MNTLSDKDWELINAYSDGELGAAERSAMDARLVSEPALRAALTDVASVSASLGALRPEPQPTSAGQVETPANRNRHPARWLIGGAVAATIALTVMLGPQFFAAPSVFDIHAEFTAQPFAVDADDLSRVAAGQSDDAPDLVNANLTPVVMRQLDRGHVTHYAGRNGCRLSYFRGTLDPERQVAPGDNQVATWSTADNVGHVIVAAGMDQRKFEAITAYLKLATREQSNAQMTASLADTIADAERCVS
ncbi:MAG: anti-sigma factor family protein [Paracoccaceae bacterium]